MPLSLLLIGVATDRLSHKVDIAPMAQEVVPELWAEDGSNPNLEPKPERNSAIPCLSPPVQALPPPLPT